ncbi:FAD-dependent oxidoreductase [Rhodoferax sp.]|uniref:FAD-dependent oxidoreductase n=1 Tax=Rhodoferax sp. TaxID=50421 RepID=UPI002ACE43C0|nr:FAD-dependent oxidoreductase [Rhodoferax sp.]MDZ7920473.1 FAD-dependent oxidoreductase [Rhodoferax sp.]
MRFATKHLKVKMKIAVVGAGVVGIATAYELAMDGHAVTVFDKSAAACEEASFANSGLIAPSMYIPFAFPGDKGNAFARLIHTGRHLTQRPWRSLQQIKSLRRWTRYNTSEVRAKQVALAQTLGKYSANQLANIVERNQMEIERSEGQLVLVESEQSLQRLQPALEALKSEDIDCKVLTPAEARKFEPALHSEASFHAALWLPGDHVANCRQFALELKHLTQKLGVTYQFGADLLDLGPQTLPNLTFASPQGTELVSADHVVLCTGQIPPHLKAKFPLHMPLVSLHGYALSVAVREPLNAPRSAVHDLRENMVINRLGNRIRVCAGAELGIKSDVKDARVVNAMYRALELHFPGAANYPAGTQVWQGTRHTITDGLPAIGPSGLANVSLNLGHGACGWTWACGSARLLADQIAGRPTDVTMSPLLPTRFIR